ncbi:hypothetical protein [Sulfurospirillum sp. 1612]|uniref:hypothetical protein n=1 Tax=Sulfurospirillum sp. 1612 TaxID=3094835 RepID=UPI002F931E83
MLSKVILVLFVGMILVISGIYFTYNSSYQDSFQARFYYFVGNYTKAYELAQEAYHQDQYNKMASTVLAQSKIALAYENFIQLGSNYLEKIENISTKKKYSNDDKIRIKMMCQIVLGEYEKLSPTKLTNQDLIENSKKINDKFAQLYKELF